MNSEEKLTILGASAKYDVSCCGGGRKEVQNYASGIYYSVMPDGSLMPILKTLFTNKCKNNCKYCVNRISHDIQRVSFEAQELADLFMKIYQKGYVFGLFLSSGVDDKPNLTQAQMIAVCEILRYHYQFRGFIHLKILPGMHSSLIEKAAQLATRISINIEAPNPKRLAEIAPGKDFIHGILAPMEEIKKNLRSYKSTAKQTTQFVVGAGQETDQEIVKTMFWLRQHKNIHRTYFSAYLPIDNTQTENQNLRQSYTREHRLYQVEFLQRKYGFDQSEIYFNKDGQLPGNIDPKLHYALKNPALFPIEINRADQSQLIRIPGIGEVGAKKIMLARSEGRLNYIEQLQKLGINTQKSAPFILINGRAQGKLKEVVLAEQLTLL